MEVSDIEPTTSLLVVRHADHSANEVTICHTTQVTWKNNLCNLYIHMLLFFKQRNNIELLKHGENLEFIKKKLCVII